MGIWIPKDDGHLIPTIYGGIVIPIEFGYVGKWIFKTKVFVNFGLILRWAPHVLWVMTTWERVLLREEMKFVYSHVKIH